VCKSAWCKSFLLVLATAACAGENSPALDEIRAAKTAGVCVQIGCGDGSLTAELAQCGNLLVQALDGDEALVQTARRTLIQEGLYGQASVEHWTGSSLPYEDNLVNALVAGSPGKIGDKEILRVLAPNGAAWIQRGGNWRVLRKPWPKEFDEWTHWRHGPDGNMTSRDTAVNVPSGVRWVAGPAEDAGGRKWYYDHLMVSSAGRNFYVFDDSIAARDAFNGRLLWTKDIKTPTLKETGLPVIIKEKIVPASFRTFKVRPVASSGALFCIAHGQLVALDVATGAEVQAYGTVQEPREILFCEGILLATDKTGIRAYDQRAKTLWKREGNAKLTAAGDGAVFQVGGEEVASLDLATGEKRWRVTEPRAVKALTCTYGCGVLVLERSTLQNEATGCGIEVLSGADGARLWAKDYKPGMSHYQEARAFFARGLLWLQLEKGKVGGFDPRTGQQQKELGSRGGHCAPPIATERFLIAPEMEFTGLDNGKQARARMTRSSCRNPYVPANGLLYTFPLQCECFPMLRGYMALAHMDSPDTENSGRLKKGPAYGRDSSARVPHASRLVAGSDAGAEEWPMYRHDVSRSGSAPAAVQLAELSQLWQVRIATPQKGLLAADWKDNPYVKGPLTQPVAAGGLVLAAIPDAHQLVALDAKTGARKWSFIAGGRIDTPPSVFEDLCLFGAHDGRVYCVGLADGELAWQFRAAPRECSIMAYGQMESPWPVAGSVLVDGGTAYFAAGRHPAADGGVHAFALNARSGQVRWRKVLTDTGVKNWYAGLRPNSKIKWGVDYEPVDMWVKDGDCVAMSRWRFDPEDGHFDLAINSPEYLAGPGLTVPRGLWGYGIRQTKLVMDRPPAVFSAGELFTGTKGDTALLLAGDALIAGRADGTLNAGGHSCKLDAPAIHDGIIAAYGRVYLSTADGKVVCLGKEGPR